MHGIWVITQICIIPQIWVIPTNRSYHKYGSYHKHGSYHKYGSYHKPCLSKITFMLQNITQYLFFTLVWLRYYESEISGLRFCVCSENKFPLWRSKHKYHTEKSRLSCISQTSLICWEFERSNFEISSTSFVLRSYVFFLAHYTE